MTVYQLFLTVVIAGQQTELPLAQYQRFEHCWQAAEILTHNRADWTARCVRVEVE
jgi:hypothetical protein